MAGNHAARETGGGDDDDMGNPAEMSQTTPQPAGAMVIFGITGDLARKMTLPALYQLERRGALTCPVVGVASTPMGTQELLQRARQAIEGASGAPVDDAVFGRLARRLTYLAGDVTDPQLYKLLAAQLAGARRPLYYLEMPPS
ncbi:MAG: hypothetical protein ACRDNF_06510, partial [Streptosporangiaceae bacterium]